MKNKDFLNRDIRVISIVFAALFIAVAVYLGIFLANDAQSVINNPYNRRTEDYKKKVIRGDILSEDGDVLAFTHVNEDGSTVRVYPYGREFAHVVGFEANGGLGIESKYNYTLLKPGVGFFKNISNEINGEKSPGISVKTTLDPDLQEECIKALKGISGGVIVIEPETGHIMALCSAPDFDPSTIEDDWESIISGDKGGILFNRVTQGAILPSQLDIGGIVLDCDIFTKENVFSAIDTKEGDGFATILQYADVFCAIANDGYLMNNMLVSGYIDAAGKTSKTFAPSRSDRLYTTAECEEYLKVLKGNVDLGDGYEAFAVKGECPANDPEAAYMSIRTSRALPKKVMKKSLFVL